MSDLPEPWCERYDDGTHRAMSGRTGPGTLEALMRGEVASALYSDPPWGPGNASFWRTHARLSAVAGEDAWQAVRIGLRDAIEHHVSAPAPVWIEMGERWADEVDALVRAAHSSESHRRWSTRYRSGSRLLPAVLLYAGPRLPDGFDPSALRGASLPRACLAACSLEAGSVVLDPFCGKGYTARAAARLGLRFRGIELNPHRLGYTARWLTKSRS